MFIFQKRYPPKYRESALNLFGEMEAWRSGEPEHLAYYYPRYSTHDTRTSRTMIRSYTQTHVDIGARFNVAALVSNYMGDLLFGSEPKLWVEGNDGATEALQMFLDDHNIWSKFREAASVASLYGGVYVCTEWDAMLGKVALVAVPPSSVYPHFWHDKLVSATLVSVLPEYDDMDHGKVYRHFQQHEMGQEGPRIVHSLWCGTHDKLGYNLPLTAHYATTMIEGEPVPLLTDGNVAAEDGAAPMGVAVRVPGDRIMVEYVPNKYPSCLGAEGESDLYPVRSAMFRLDQAVSSWARDIRLGKTRIAYSPGLGGKQDQVDRFDFEQEIFYAVHNMTGSREDPMPIKQMKMDIRAEEHRVTIVGLLEEIAAGVGVSPMQLGSKPDSPAETGIALKRRMNRTLETQQTKRRYWEKPVVCIVENLLTAAGAAGIPSPGAIEPNLMWGPSIEPALEETAQTIFSLAQAGAVSIQTKVKMLHPDYNETQVMEEVERIKEETNIGQTAENPTNMGGGPVEPAEDDETEEDDTE